MTFKQNKSKKQSDTKQLATERPESLVFYLERSLGSKLVFNALQDAGVTIEWHVNHFAQDAHDVDWLTKAGEMDWVVLLRDQKIKSRWIERDALTRAGVRAFVIIAGSMGGEEMAAVILKALPKIIEMASTVKGPYLAKITRDGTVKMWMDSNALYQSLVRPF